MNIEDFIESVEKQFEYYKYLGDNTFKQLNDEALFWQPNNISNSIAIIISHLHGNMLSRWTDFLITDGEKEWRNRDSEFEKVMSTRAELISQWDVGWLCLFNALKTINSENYNLKIYIRNEEHTIISAIHRQLAHYTYHIGQIVQLGKMCKNASWKSLSIPLNKSKTFNHSKLSKGKH